MPSSECLGRLKLSEQTASRGANESRTGPNRPLGGGQVNDSTKPLAGRHAIVTGGGRGIGKAMASVRLFRSKP
jgi:hypothetical protein